MRTSFKLIAFAAIFSVFYAGAFFILKGINEFEKVASTALFTNKADATAIANVEKSKDKRSVAVSTGIWK